MQFSYTIKAQMVYNLIELNLVITLNRSKILNIFSSFNYCMETCYLQNHYFEINLCLAQRQSGSSL